MTRAAALTLLTVAYGTACVPDPGRPDRTAEAYRLIVDAEDARPAGGDTLRTLLTAAELDHPLLRRIAVRALGRLENPGLSEEIADHLEDESTVVRRAAAEALAQSVHRGDGSSVLDALLERVEEESDPEVRGALARSLGRLRLSEADRRRVAAALLELGRDGADTPLETLLGIALGFESFVRLSAGGGIAQEAADLLVDLLTYRAEESSGAGEGAGRVRALAAFALGASRRLSLELIQRGLDDPEAEVRRTVVAYLDAVPPSARDGLVREALADPSARVQVAAVRYLGASARTASRCELLISAAGPEVKPAVRITALEALARPCPTIGAQRTAMVEAAEEIAEPGAPWQPAAQALLSLTRIDTEPPVRLLPRFVQHESPFVRSWAARAAAALRDAATLRALSDDESPNVRGEALTGLFAIQGHAVDELLVEQLEDDDPLLLMTVAGLLEGAPDRRPASEAMLAAFERISLAERETWRDPRIALLERLEELGDESLTEGMTPFLRDYDLVVADRVAGVLTTWTGGEYDAEPQLLRRTPVPTLEELRALEESTLTLHIQDGVSVVIELLADQATTNVVRLVRLAEAGYYDGLTFHRWAPNFVIQGGSPGANEFQGDGPYTRDEVGGTSHWRGTVGLSTRGRDTGDGQIFVNLVHNPRLDYDYTVMGRVVSGHDALDGILEGAVIERAEVAPGP